MTRKSSGETFAQIKAERRNPKGDVWWGGTGDPHLQAAEEGLTQEYKSPRLPELAGLGPAPGPSSPATRPWASMPAPWASATTASFTAKHKLTAPKCWADLTKPEFKGHVQMANPNSSGTAYTTLATIVQVFGEEKGFEFMKGLHKNINQYTKSGSAPIKASARGETTVGIVFQHDAVTQAVKGFPIKIVSPCEGTGYEIGSVSIIKGGRNPESAKKWVDFALDPKIQTMAAKAKAYQVPSNCQGHPAAAGAGPEPDQADRLRLQEVRVVRRAAPAAEEVGRRGFHAAALSV